MGRSCTSPQDCPSHCCACSEGTERLATNLCVRGVCADTEVACAEDSVRVGVACAIHEATKAMEAKVQQQCSAQ